MSPKFVNILFSAACVLVIVSSFLKIMHVSYGTPTLIFGFIPGGVASYFYVENLKSRIKELERKLSSLK